MPRPRKINRPVPMRIYLPEDLHAKVNLLHFSAALGRVPYGAISEWFEKLARQELEKSYGEVQKQLSTEDQLTEPEESAEAGEAGTPGTDALNPA